jgi:hypothetical protein
VEAQISMFFTSNEYSAPMATKKIYILEAILDLPARQHSQFNPYIAKIGQMG